MTDTARITARVNGRSSADDVIDMLGEPIEDKEFMLAFVERISEQAKLIEPPAPEIKPEPIGRLGATVMPFGQHNGKTFDETPLDYLDWLCSGQEDFYKVLRAYLKHPDLQSRRRGIDP